MNNFNRLGVMLDCSRNGIPNVNTIKKFIDVISKMGYNTLLLYMEDVYEVNSQPYFGHLRGKYSKQELSEINEYGNKQNIEIIPCIQTLAHLGTIFKWEQYLPIHDCSGILLIDEEKTYKLIEDMVSSLRECVSTDILHIGMDEAFFVGLGNYRLQHGNVNRFELLLRHLYKVKEIAKKYGFKTITWSDMFFNLLNSSNNFDSYNVEDAVKMVPKDVGLVHWEYYIKNRDEFSDSLKKHKKFNNEIWFASGAICWTGFAPANEYSIGTCKTAIECCVENGIRNTFVTLWGDDGRECSFWSVLPTLFCNAEYAKGNFDEQNIKSGFYALTGIPFDDYMMLDFPNKVDDKPAIFNNPNKYFFYSDLFMGISDCYVQKGFGKTYKKYSEQLLECATNDEYGYLFQSMSSFCKVLSIKTELGVKTRRAYWENNKKELRELANNDYEHLIKDLESFYSDFKRLWFTDNKPQGFEIHDARIGGLIQRAKSCRERLLDYSNGVITEIPELSEPVLDYLDNGGADRKEQTMITSYSNIVSRGY